MTPGQHQRPCSAEQISAGWAALAGLAVRRSGAAEWLEASRPVGFCYDVWYKTTKVLVGTVLPAGILIPASTPAQPALLSSTERGLIVRQESKFVLLFFSA